MIERLLENWLDSASERSYQAVFVQMLSADGYTVLHSTRHCLLEFGKDILAVAPDGVGCAFQLKGDPRGRITVGVFRKDIQPQLVQLMAQAPSYPGFPSGPHRAYLVSNGQYEEEVQAATREMNAAPFPAKVELWSRGHLLEMSKRHATRLWPSEITDNRALLELYLANAKDQLPQATLASMLLSVLSLAIDAPKLGAAELARVASSAAWLTGISTASFAEKENNSAVAIGWTICCVMLIAAADKHGFRDFGPMKGSFDLAEKALLDALAALWHEVRGREHLVEGDAFTDPEVYSWRITVLYGLLTSLAIANATLPLLDEEEQRALHEWLRFGGHRPEIWGEAAIANILPWLIWLRKEDATMRPDREIDAVASIVVKLNQPKSKQALPNPHYTFESVMRHRLRLEKQRSGIEDETFAGTSFTAEALFHLLVRTNLKQSCKWLWPEFTKLGHRKLRLSHPWHYCTLRAPAGVDETQIYPSTYEWSALRREAVEESGCTMPEQLRRRPWLVSMWWQAAPHRATAESSKVLANALVPGWGT